MPALAALASTDVKSAAPVRVKVANGCGCQFAEASAGREGSAHQLPEVIFRRVHEALSLGYREIAHPGRVGFLERCDRTPGRIRWDLLLAPRVIERGLQDRQGSICRRPTTP